MLNKIFDQNPSQILGSLNANGRVFLVNPNGMYFGKSARLNVGSLVATTLKIDSNKFMSGMNVFGDLTNKVRLCERSEPQSEPFVGQAW